MSRYTILELLLIASIALAQQAPSLPKTTSPDDQYVLAPDSQPHTGVPDGKVIEFKLNDSKIFPGFEHKWWLYIPAQYDGKKPAALMAFLDGEAYVGRNGEWRVPVVLDNLIAKRELPVMVAIFINAGQSIGRSSDGKPMASNRSVEYDTLNADYATFLLEEILPEVRKHVTITNDPKGRGACGRSSGGIAAFTIAWQRPDQFRKVLSFLGSFTNIRGGNIYPDLVRQAKRKPIRIFQQDGINDMVVEGWGSWPQANKAMAAALDEKGYDHKFVMGEGTHNEKHGGSIFPDAMRWLWRDYPR
jgi:enterochelin esterase-like enzyme